MRRRRVARVGASAAAALVRALDDSLFKRGADSAQPLALGKTKVFLRRKAFDACEAAWAASRKRRPTTGRWICDSRWFFSRVVGTGIEAL